MDASPTAVPAASRRTSSESRSCTPAPRAISSAAACCASAVPS
jgi:hypothetical protein